MAQRSAGIGVTQEAMMQRQSQLHAHGNAFSSPVVARQQEELPQMRQGQGLLPLSQMGNDEKKALFQHLVKTLPHPEQARFAQLSSEEKASP
jgi:hypothetical protein